jgi:hypothetical protein
MATTEEKGKHWKGNNNILGPRTSRKITFSPHSISKQILERGGQLK